MGASSGPFFYSRKHSFLPMEIRKPDVLITRRLFLSDLHWPRPRALTASDCCANNPRTQPAPVIPNLDPIRWRSFVDPLPSAADRAARSTIAPRPTDPAKRVPFYRIAMKAICREAASRSACRQICGPMADRAGRSLRYTQRTRTMLVEWVNAAAVQAFSSDRSHTCTVRRSECPRGAESYTCTADEPRRTAMAIRKTGM